MDFSRLKHKITIQKPIDGGHNSMGEVVLRYVDLVTVRANVSPISGREYLEAQKIQAETAYKVIIRYLPGITHDMRVKYNDRILEIQSVLNIGELNTELWLMCLERG